MDLVTAGFCAASDVFGVLGEAVSSDAPTLSRIATQILAASQIFCNLTSLDPQMFSAQGLTKTEFYRGRPGLRKFPLRNSPIQSITTVVISQGSLPTTIPNAVPPSPDGFQDGFVFDDLCIEFVGCYDGFWWSNQRLSIQYTAGYGGVPSDVSYAVASTVALWKKQGKNVGIITEAISGASTAYDKSDLPKIFMTTVANYSPKVPWLT